MDDIEELLNIPAETDETHEKPCRTCRKRKVRCSKTQPCSNCQRNGAECIYDEPAQSGRKAVSTSTALEDRVVELEALVSSLRQQLSVRGGEAAAGQSAPRKERVFVAERTLQRLVSEIPEISIDLARTVNGRLVSNRGSSRFLINSFWASMYEDVRIHFRL